MGFAFTPQSSTAFYGGMGGAGYLPAARPYCPYPTQVGPGSRAPKDHVDHLQDRYKRIQAEIKKKEAARKKVQKTEQEYLDSLEGHFNHPFSAMISQHVVHKALCCEYTLEEQGIAHLSPWQEGLHFL